jgi:hypothetical protein
MLVHLICPRPLLFCPVDLDAPRQKKIVHMVRILHWHELIQCGRFRECLGNNPGRPKLKQRIGRMACLLKDLDRTYSSGGFPVEKLHFW